MCAEWTKSVSFTSPDLIRSYQLSTVGDRAFPVAAAWVSNTLSLEVSSQPSLCQLSNVGWRRSSFYRAFRKLLQLHLTNLPIILWSDCVTFTNFCKVVLQCRLNATLIIFVNNNNNTNNNNNNNNRQWSLQLKADQLRTNKNNLIIIISMVSTARGKTAQHNQERLPENLTKAQRRTPRKKTMEGPTGNAAKCVSITKAPETRTWGTQRVQTSTKDCFSSVTFYTTGGYMPWQWYNSHDSWIRGFVTTGGCVCDIYYHDPCSTPMQPQYYCMVTVQFCTYQMVMLLCCMAHMYYGRFRHRFFDLWYFNDCDSWNSAYSAF